MRASSPLGPANSSMRRRRRRVAASKAERMPRTSPSVRSPNVRRALRAAFSAATALAFAGSIVPSMGRSSSSSSSLASSSSSSSPSAFGGRGGGSRGSKIALHSTVLASKSLLIRSVAASTSRWQSSASASMAWSNSASATSCRAFRLARNCFCRSRRFSLKAPASLPTLTIGMQPPRRSPMSRAAAPVMGAGTPAAPWWNTASRLSSPRRISGAAIASRGGCSRR
mmetsp:Transcript_59067/g.140764  ORF Transcript_59067/g.140764 Transcript_59067/m.140764 type:complete len:226 (+) Transcript_59067:84-761(+)